jgi:hypothetical protein
MEHGIVTRQTAFACVLLAVFLPTVTDAPAGLPPQDLERAWHRYMAEDATVEPALRYPFASCFRAASRQQGLPETLLLALARGESFFDPRAVSDRNCHGIMQIQWPATARELGVTRLSDLYDPCINIRAGAAYLRRMLDRYDRNLHLALAAYNYGPGRIPRDARSGDLPEGARWYSGYIYRHLQAVLTGDGGGTTTGGKRRRSWDERRSEIITFGQPYRAESFLAYVEARAPSLSLAWFRTGVRRYQVVLLYRSARELAEGRAALKRLGLHVNS